MNANTRRNEPVSERTCRRDIRPVGGGFSAPGPKADPNRGAVPPVPPMLAHRVLEFGAED